MSRKVPANRVLLRKVSKGKRAPGRGTAGGPSRRYQCYVFRAAAGHRRLKAALEEFLLDLQEKKAEPLKQELQSTAGRIQMAMEDGDIDHAWALLSHARREEMTGFDDNQRKVVAAQIRHEVGHKLASGWRRSAINEIVGTPSAPNEEATVEGLRAAMKLRDEHYQNVYYKMGNLRDQLVLLGSALFLLLGLLVILSYKGALGLLGLSHWSDLLAVMILGALGGSLSAVMSLWGGRTQAQIPEQLETGAITVSRPIVGAAAAVAAYMFLKVGIVPLKESAGVEYLLIAFVAGFSERFVLSAVGKVSASDEGRSKQK